MTWLGEFLVHAINALVPDFPQHADLLNQLVDERGHFRWEYEDGQRTTAAWTPKLDVTGQRVLDMGCGAGAKALLYSQMGAAEVVGIELDQTIIERAKQGLAERAATDPAARRVRFVQGDATRLPFDTGAFDVIVCNNSLEHIEPPDRALAECGRVLRPGGRAYLRFPPYWSAWGPHLERWIRFPWCHLLFAEPTLIAAVNRIEAQTRTNDHLPGYIRLDLRGLTRLPHVNHLTMAEFDRYVAPLPLRALGYQMLPTGFGFLPRLAQRLGPLGGLAHAANALLHHLAHTRWGRETLATKAVIVLEKYATD